MTCFVLFFPNTVQTLKLRKSFINRGEFYAYSDRLFTTRREGLSAPNHLQAIA